MGGARSRLLKIYIYQQSIGPLEEPRVRERAREKGREKERTEKVNRRMRSAITTFNQTRVRETSSVTAGCALTTEKRCRTFQRSVRPSVKPNAKRKRWKIRPSVNVNYKKKKKKERSRAIVIVHRPRRRRQQYDGGIALCVTRRGGDTGGSTSAREKSSRTAFQNFTLTMSSGVNSAAVLKHKM